LTGTGIVDPPLILCYDSDDEPVALAAD
jgi:hypothetical protein